MFNNRKHIHFKACAVTRCQNHRNMPLYKINVYKNSASIQIILNYGNLTGF